MGKYRGDLPHLQKEIALLKQGYRFIAGLDEAGRGAWAGPVVAAAVILPLDRPDIATILAGLNDSKQLSPKRREHFFEIIQQTALSHGVGSVSAQVVDEVNVLVATRQAMQEAVANLLPAPDYLLIDHVKLSALALPQSSFPKADCISLTVAAASIIAKVTRDRFMVRLSETYPGYGFERHKGYGTADHRTALAKLGTSAIHRLSYRPLQRGFI